MLDLLGFSIRLGCLRSLSKPSMLLPNLDIGMTQPE